MLIFFVELILSVSFLFLLAAIKKTHMWKALAESTHQSYLIAFVTASSSHTHIGPYVHMLCKLQFQYLQKEKERERKENMKLNGSEWWWRDNSSVKLHSFSTSSSVCQCVVQHFASFQFNTSRNAMGYCVGGTNECNLQIITDFVPRDSILHLMNWCVYHTQAQHTCVLPHAEFHLNALRQCVCMFRLNEKTMCTLKNWNWIHSEKRNKRSKSSDSIIFHNTHNH